MNSFVNDGLSMHLAVCQSVTMPALLPPSAQPSAKEILIIWLCLKCCRSTKFEQVRLCPRLIAFFLKDNL